MRTIKFRAWDKINKKMYQSTYAVSESGEWGMAIDYTNECERTGKEQLIQMQYTGLLDKQGKEIYEGDIVKFENGSLPPKQVTFEYGMFMLGNDDLWHYVSKKEYIVIGNIYENPKLLEGK